MFFHHGIKALSHDQIRRQAPAVFATQPHSKTSERYLFVDTSKLLRGMESEGWSCVAASQQMNRASTVENRDTNKHALFFARTEMLTSTALANVGDTIPMIKSTNAHNGMAAYELGTGYFRKACSNGLTVPESIYSAPKVRHTKDMYDAAIEATYKVLNDFPLLMQMKQALQSIELSSNERLLLADTAAEIFFDRDERNKLNAMANRYGDRYLLESQLVAAKRSDDRKLDLWTVSNVIQENLIRGNIQTVANNGRLNYKRKVTSIDRDSEIHDKLFAMTKKFAELKGVKIGNAA